MDLDLLETPGTKQVTKSKKRRSVRIRRKSQIHGLGPSVCDENKADDICLVNNDIQDVSIASVTSDVGKPTEANTLQTSQNQYGSVWMDTDSPEMAELVMRRIRRKSNVHLPIMPVIDRLESPGVLNELEPELNDQHLSMEQSRTGDMNNSPETNVSRLSGSYIVPQSRHPQQENDCSSACNSFSEYLPSDNSTASLSPCFEASDYNIGRAFKHLNPTLQQNHNSFGVGEIDSTNAALESKIVLSPVERTLPGTSPHLTSNITPVDKPRGLLSDSTSNLTPYSPSQPIFKNISPPEFESPNSTFSPIYLTPADKVTRSNGALDDDDDDEDIWKTCKKTIVSDIDGNVIKTPGASRKSKTLVSTQKKLSKSKSNSSTKVLSKEQTSGFLSICRSLAGKLAHAVKNSPDSDQNNQMSSSDNSFTSIKPISASTSSSETATITVKSAEKNLDAVVSSAHSSDICAGVVTTDNSSIASFGEGKNVSSNILSENKSGQNLDGPDSIKNASSLSVITTQKREEDGVNSFMCENIELKRSTCDGELSPVQNVHCEKLTKTSDAYVNQQCCLSTSDTTDETLKSKSYSRSEVVEVSNRQTMGTNLQSDTPGCSQEAIAQHLEVCFDYIDPEPVQVTNIINLASQTGQQQEAKNISLGSGSTKVCTAVDISDPIDTTVISKLEPDTVRMVKTEHTGIGRKSTELVIHESASCKLSESVNKLSLNTAYDMDTCSTDDCAVSGSKPKKSKSSSDNGESQKSTFTSSGSEVKRRHPRKALSNSTMLAQQSLGGVASLKTNTLSVENVSDEKMSTVSDEPLSTCMENKHMSTLPSAGKVKNKGSTQKIVSSKITSSMCSESVPTCLEKKSAVQSVDVGKKRGRPRKLVNCIPPVVVEGVSDINLSSQRGDEVQKSSSLHQFNNKPVKDSTDMQRNILESKHESVDSIKVLTAEDLKSLDEYLGIEDPEPVIIPPPKKRGRPRKSVDGQKMTKQAKVFVDSATTSDTISGNTDKLVDSTRKHDPEKSVGMKEDSRKMDVQTIVKDTLVAELEDLELLEKPKRKSSRIQRRSIEIYRQIQNDNSTEDVPMSPLETVEESNSTTAVLQDVSDNHGNTQNNQDPKAKIVRKRKLTKNEPTVEEIYKNKNFKRPAPKIWETIYEAPSEEQVYSKKRYRRSILFDESLLVPPAKTKMRLRKAIKNGMDPRQRRKKMLSDVAVKKKLAKMEAILEDDILDDN